jgi:hypothetical protein
MSGAATYGGCVVLVLGGALLRLRNDLDAEREWNATEPSFNSCSLGAIVVASANGFRHADNGQQLILRTGDSANRRTCSMVRWWDAPSPPRQTPEDVSRCFT